jgi:serine/threonine protein kinase
LIEADSTPTHHWEVIELLGPSISAVRRALPTKKYSAYSVLRLSLEMLKTIWALHKRGFIHRDIKPGNFMIRPDRKHPLCLIDYGLSYSYRVPGSQEHVEFNPNAGFCGTCRYASNNAHNGLQLSRRDDLLSWLYCVVELATGELPWPGSSDPGKTANVKSTITAVELCESLPVEFIEICESITAVEFAEKPKYGFIARKIQRAVKVGSFPDRRFDWESLPPAAMEELASVPMTMRGKVDQATDVAISMDCWDQCGCCGCCGSWK